MNRLGKSSTSNQEGFEDDEIFNDSEFLANFDETSFNETNVFESNLLNTSTLNVSALCCDEEISGYDKLTGQTWIYPTNYPVRDYQFNIIKSALLKNTLVSLPTGLGKTFIAAVIMYNFYRWYPLGKIVFTAPTRPLVAQQIDACYNIIAIPPKDTIEMTGHMPVNTRKTHWKNKRVFFATPQVIYNDLKAGICPADKMRCLVIDEAHKARGNYAYCQIVATLDEMGHKSYRMLALSATPGSKVDDVINVVRSLHIAHLELRTENCIDVAPYRHSRKINTVIVQLGPDLTHIRQQYVEILDGYARRLKQFNILPQNLGNLSKGRIVMLYKEYQTKDRGARHPQHNYIMRDFNLLITLYHGLELLVKHGSRVFLNFFDEHPEKSWMHTDDRLTALLETLRDSLGTDPMSLDRSILPDGTIPEVPKDLCFGHPKFDKLKSIIVDHFTVAKQKNQDTRAIIFCEYRDSVSLVHCLLLQCRPLISPQMFVGQGASGRDGKAVVSQKAQLRVMRKFREGQCNTLVATCVAEEGLDVGSVDLIICFDISTRSPIRLVQRCGRTGRERGGQVYILVTEGREHQTLMDCMRQRDGLNQHVLKSKEVENNLYKSNPRMMPHGFTPECQKMFITVAKKNDTKETSEKPKKSQKDLRTMLLNSRASSGNAISSSKEDNIITEEEFNKLFPSGVSDKKSFTGPNYWAMSKDTIKTRAMVNQDTDLNLATWLEWQRTLQKTVTVGHSKDTQFLSNILQQCDTKRLEPTQNEQIMKPELHSQNIPASSIQTQSNTGKQTKKKQKGPVGKSPTKMYGDIRALFSRTTKSTKNYTKLINDLGLQNDHSVPTRLIDLLVDLNLNVDKKNNLKVCYVCKNICDCQTIQKVRKSDDKKPILLKLLEEPILPDLDLIDDIDLNAIKQCERDIQASQDPRPFNSDVEKVTTSKDNHTCSDNNFNLEFDFDALDEEKSSETQLVQEKSIADKDFEADDMDDIFADSSLDELMNKVERSAASTDKDNDTQNKETDTKKTLQFFGLDSIDDIFADYIDDSDQEPSKAPSPHESKTTSTVKDPAHALIKDSEEVLKEKSPQTKNNTIIETFKVDNVPSSGYPLSPSILSGKVKSKKRPASPILCSQTRRFQSSNKEKTLQSSTPSTVRKKLPFSRSDKTDNDIVKNNDDNHHETISSSLADTSDKSLFTVTQLVEIINKTDDNLTQSNANAKRMRQNISVNKRSTSPVFLTQADRKSTARNNNSKNNITKSQPNERESLIILDSDSDSNDTETYELDKEMSRISTDVVATADCNQVRAKRKFEDESSIASPYFNKKQKLDNAVAKPVTLQEKVLAAVTSNKIKYTNNQTNYHFTVTQPRSSPQKENKNPIIETNKRNSYIDNNKTQKQASLDVLQQYRKESKIQTLRNKFDSIFKKSASKSEETTAKKIEESDDFMMDDKWFSPTLNTIRSPQIKDTPVKKRIFYDSDDDFVDDKHKCLSVKKPKTVEIVTTNHKARRRKRNKDIDKNSFIEMEASLSDAGADSGDELSDDSVGSIAEFICDDDADVTRQDIHSLYLKSVRSPVKKNGFKIPELPKKFKKEDVFSQFVEEDSYEMDSFCVDSHIELTQANDVSELELAEMILEMKRKSKRKAKQRSSVPQENGDSPLIRRTNKISKRQIHSDSDDSS